VPLALLAAQPAFRLAPAVAAEAEGFRVEPGRKVVRNGPGNYNAPRSVQLASRMRRSVQVIS
jgi:hypothetical protein